MYNDNNKQTFYWMKKDTDIAVNERIVKIGQ